MTKQNFKFISTLRRGNTLVSERFRASMLIFLILVLSSFEVLAIPCVSPQINVRGVCVDSVFTVDSVILQVDLVLLAKHFCLGFAFHFSVFLTIWMGKTIAKLFHKNLF